MEIETVERYLISKPTKRKKIWNKDEEEAMLQFMFLMKEKLEEHMIQCINKNGRRNKSYFFKQMEKYIGTKTDSQCKSRFQKLEKRLLKKIGIEEKLMESYFKSKKQRKPLSELRENGIKEPCKEESIKELVLKKPIPKADRINSYSQLKTMITKLIIPFIKDKDIRDRMVFFAHELEDIKEGDTLEELFCRSNAENDPYGNQLKLFFDDSEPLFFSE